MDREQAVLLLEMMPFEHVVNIVQEHATLQTRMIELTAERDTLLLALGRQAVQVEALQQWVLSLKAALSVTRAFAQAWKAAAKRKRAGADS